MLITGCAYYPEHWDEKHWPEDAKLMRAAGLQVVRLAEFAWDKMEPEAGEYDWALLDQAIEILAAEGLQILLCTPTPTPPPWLTEKHPDICRAREDGVRISPGGRRHATANSPAYLDYSRRITEAITARYGQHPALIGWQVDNEFGCGETTRSHGEHDKRAFQAWLEEKYGSLAALNAAWGTQFWGMTYHDWAHIPVPGITTEPQSPAMRLDFRRFSSEAWVRFQRMQIEIIQRNSPGRFITHNFMIRHWSLDYWRLGADLDFVSYDNYPHGLRDEAEVSMNLDLMWSLKRRAFWIMEQQPGQVNWHPYNPPLPPGQVATWSHQAVAHGAEAVVYFRYRAARFGQEQRHAGLLKWDRGLDQAYFEAQQVGQQFQALPPKLHREAAKVGIVFDYDDLWAIELEPHHQDFSYWEQVYEIYKVFWQANIQVDFLPRNVPYSVLSQYETVVLPSPIIHQAGEAQVYETWVEKGGQLLATFRAGYREPGNISVEDTLPAGWRALFGLEIEKWASLPPASYTAWPQHRPATTMQDEKHSLPLKIWAEALKLNGAQALYHYSDGIFKGQAACAEHTVGRGRVIYAGAWPQDWRPLLAKLGYALPVQATQTAYLYSEEGEPWRVTLDHTALNVHYENMDGGN
jgi:beta-galactosidase